MRGRIQAREMKFHETLGRFGHPGKPVELRSRQESIEGHLVRESSVSRDPCADLNVFREPKTQATFDLRFLSRARVVIGAQGAQTFEDLLPKSGGVQSY